jgi:hypothetical protein
VAPIAYATIVALAQASDGGGTAVAPSDFRLQPGPPGVRVTPPCGAGEAGEIVVCGRRDQGQRLRPLAPPPGLRPHQSPGIDLGGGVRAEPHVSEVAMPDGRLSKRVTIDLKIPF